MTRINLPPIPENAFITCDPGSGGTGLALFFPEHPFPMDTKVIKCPINDWEIKQRMILSTTDAYLVDMYERGCRKLFIELPQYMNSVKGEIAAKSNALGKLLMVYGGIKANAELRGYTTKPIIIGHWKGQLDKHKVNIRIKKIIGAEFEDHIADAVGMGLYLKGKFK